MSGDLAALARLGEGPLGWHALGGIASALYVVAAIVLYPRIGAVLAVGLIITGQMLASLTLDLSGLFGVALRAPGAGMLIGAAAILAGAVAIVRGRRIARAPASVGQGGLRWRWSPVRPCPCKAPSTACCGTISARRLPSAWSASSSPPSPC